MKDTETIISAPVHTDPATSPLLSSSSSSVPAAARDDELVLEDSDDEFVDQFLESTWQDGVETGLTVRWPTLPLTAPLHLSTQLPESSMAPLFDGTGWAGTRVWKAALLAVQYMEQEYLSKKQDGHNPLSLLELGCGLGVPGMLWHRLQKNQHSNNNNSTTTLFPSFYKVVLTDRPSLLSQLQGNLERNFPKDPQIMADALDWSPEGVRKLLLRLNDECCDQGHNVHDDTTTTNSSSSYYSFDICLNCDCIYEPLYGRDSWMALADVLITLAEISRRTVVITSVERRTADGLENFLDRLDQSPFIGTTERVMRNDDDKHHIIEVYVTRPAN
ncbi:lysine methyltransferase [Nitzschia inconspicua]|uniref:Lysine methyltransferase n=1 Tax=Nitzschia inconspicua TaxID=303405 RepID=A0A9K3M4R5_9STRA|nr:lysine methyltransferase [Nitzschia inconspicua]